MSDYIHWLLLANGLAPLLTASMVWVYEDSLRIECAILMATTFVALTILNLIAAGAVWP